MKPRNDEARVATLEHLDILDSSPDSRYDDITKLLCSIFRTPISQLSLVAKDRSPSWGQAVQSILCISDGMNHLHRSGKDTRARSICKGPHS